MLDGYLRPAGCNARRAGSTTVDGPDSGTRVATLALRICIVYDCLYPYTVGGAERWYAEPRRAARGGGTRRHLPDAQAVGARTRSRTSPAFASSPSGRAWRSTRTAVGGACCPRSCSGSACSRHLLRHGGRYDVVHTASFPYFSRACRRRRASRCTASGSSWTGTRSGRVSTGASTSGGSAVRSAGGCSALCLRVPQRAFCFSRLHERRLRELGVRGPADAARGPIRRPARADEPRPAEPVVVFAGPPHPREAGDGARPGASLEAREPIPELRGEIYGDGPERERCVAAIAELGLDGRRDAPGFVTPRSGSSGSAARALPRAPSRREGYGLVVIEAAARGRRSVVVAGADNAATELVEEGVNGFVAACGGPTTSPAPSSRVHRAGSSPARSTARLVRSSSRGAVARDVARRTSLESYAEPASARS